MHDLHVDFDTRGGTVKALQGVSCSIGPGETLGLVGESGSGKSVTAHAVMGLLDAPGRLSGGDVLWQGRSLVAPGSGRWGRQVWGKDIAMVFQNPMTSLNPLMTIGDQMAEVMQLHLGLSRSQALTRAEELLAAVGISGPRRRLSQYPYEFSGGMRQRVMIAMGISCNPKLLIADEPTTALDVTIQAQILELLSDLQRQMGLSILLITHDMGIVAGLCHRVAVMYCGRIVETGNVDAIFDAPSHPYTQGLMRSTPSLDAQEERLVAIEGAPPGLMQENNGCAFKPRCPIAEARCLQRPSLHLVRPGDTVACWNAGQKAWPIPGMETARLAQESGT
ncbi:MAG: ABC transporter ATP-binding protein [Phyllobacterium sp.]